MTPDEGDRVTTPDHTENTGDNLRHAAEVQEQARHEDADTTIPPKDDAPETALPDFNT